MLGAALAASALVGCTDDANSGAGDDPFGGDAVAGSGERDVHDRPDLTRLWDEGPSVTPQVIPEELREEAAAFEEKWDVKVHGDWTETSLTLLDEVMTGTYGETKDLFGNLVSIHMTESGRIADDTLSENYGGLFSPGACASDGVGDGQCFSVADDDPTTGHIDFWGAKDEVGDAQTRKDIIQHELGHYFVVAHAKDKDWRDRFRAAAASTPPVSEYGAGHIEENYAEIWSKMTTEPGTPQGDFSWYKPPYAAFVSGGLPREAFTIMREIIRGPLRESEFVAAAATDEEDDEDG